MDSGGAGGNYPQSHTLTRPGSRATSMSNSFPRTMRSRPTSASIFGGGPAEGGGAELFVGNAGVGGIAMNGSAGPSPAGAGPDPAGQPSFTHRRRSLATSNPPRILGRPGADGAGGAVEDSLASAPGAAAPATGLNRGPFSSHAGANESADSRRLLRSQQRTGSRSRAQARSFATGGEAQHGGDARPAGSSSTATRPAPRTGGSTGRRPSFKRSDLVMLTKEVPSDGIVFSHVRGQPSVLVVYRTEGERNANPERLNLDRRQLTSCPILENEDRLKLLNYQNNYISSVTALEPLTNLIFLDLYNNCIEELGPGLSSVPSLRVLMLGKNRIRRIANLERLRNLDVLDLHSNEISKIEGLGSLPELRVLNLAGNRIELVESVACLQSLTEINLRRNRVRIVDELHLLPQLQRVFLSNNCVGRFADVASLLRIKALVELALDGNPISRIWASHYRPYVVTNVPTLRHFDLKRVSETERKAAQPFHVGQLTGALHDDALDTERALADLDVEASAHAAEAGAAYTEWQGEETRVAASDAGGANNGGQRGDDESTGAVVANAPGDRPDEAHMRDGSMQQKQQKQQKLRGDTSGGVAAESASPRPGPGPGDKSFSDSPTPDAVSAKKKRHKSRRRQEGYFAIVPMDEAGFSGLLASAPGARSGPNSPVPDPGEDGQEQALPGESGTGKGLQIVGPGWRVLQNTKMLLSVAALSVESVDWMEAATRLAPHMPSLGRLQSLRLRGNRLARLEDLQRLSTAGVLPASLRELTITENPICRLSILRPWCAFALPRLLVLDGHPITDAERSRGSYLFSKQREMMAADGGILPGPARPPMMPSLQGKSERNPTGKNDSIWQATAVHRTREGKAKANSAWDRAVTASVAAHEKAAEFSETWGKVITAILKDVVTSADKEKMEMRERRRKRVGTAGSGGLFFQAPISS
uniref:U2A'/phosphoprotein 32 family A C-terminal domain-containing protein n=1 Tax=Phaeomonas parva TaxID=124430 RepID=A0A7S1XLY3_9STRA|mmetsp:Transcript_15196/g.45699  ORF Transcript_15196/g.45699 Transcript_15196/m.45699 type:complete len:933 (+) Transcript_15196:298-3096(+)